MANESKPQPQAAHNHEQRARAGGRVSPGLLQSGSSSCWYVAGLAGRLRDLQPDAQRSSARGYDDTARGAHGDCPAAQAGYLDGHVCAAGQRDGFTDSPIYARTSGYLTHWYFDIGARVKKGQLLCEIASPEVDQQLAQAVGGSGHGKSHGEQCANPGTIAIRAWWILTQCRSRIRIHL